MWGLATRTVVKPACTRYCQWLRSIPRAPCSTWVHQRGMRVLHAANSGSTHDPVLQQLYADARAPADLGTVVASLQLPFASDSPASLTVLTSSTASVHQLEAMENATGTAASSHHMSEHPATMVLNEIPNKQELKNPSRLPFEAMYQQLVAWRMAHLSCHVPRNCFDAPPMLDAWVRHLRRLRETGNLEQWKQDRLNMLGFEWEMSDVQAKWVNMYHQLRRFKVVHGHTDVPQDYRNPDEPGWEILARWLRRQGQLLAQRKLTEQQEAMLRSVGVTLKVDEAYVKRYVNLVGLNAHERKKERRKVRNEKREARASASALELTLAAGPPSATSTSQPSGTSPQRPKSKKLGTPPEETLQAAGGGVGVARQRKAHRSEHEGTGRSDPAAVKKQWTQGAALSPGVATQRQSFATDTGAGPAAGAGAGAAGEPGAQQRDSPQSATTPPVSTLPQGLPRGQHCCYVLVSTDGSRTYTGYTTDPARRLRQHNGELVGGARATRMLCKQQTPAASAGSGMPAVGAGDHTTAAADTAGPTWRLVLVVTSPSFDRARALSFEWHLKHGPGSKGSSGVARRLRLLRAALLHDKFKEHKLCVHVCQPGVLDAVQQACAGTGAQVQTCD